MDAMAMDCGCPTCDGRTFFGCGKLCCNAPSASANGTRPASSALVAITYQYNASVARQAWLRRVVHAVVGWRSLLSVRVVLVSDDVVATAALLETAGVDGVEVVPPVNDAAGPFAKLTALQPMMLCFAHRSVMKAALDDFDLFAYLEGDMEMRASHLDAWARDEAALLRIPSIRAAGVHRGFYRWETHGGSRTVTDDYPMWLPQACAVANLSSHTCTFQLSPSRWLIGLPNPHASSWVMPRDRLRHLLVGSNRTAGLTAAAAEQILLKGKGTQGVFSLLMPGGCPWNVAECAASGDAWLGRKREWALQTVHGCLNRFVVPFSYATPGRAQLDPLAGLQHHARNFPGGRPVETCLAGHRIVGQHEPVPATELRTRDGRSAKVAAGLRTKDALGAPAVWTKAEAHTAKGGSSAAARSRESDVRLKDEPAIPAKHKSNVAAVPAKYKGEMATVPVEHKSESAAAIPAKHKSNLVAPPVKPRGSPVQQKGDAAQRVRVVFALQYYRNAAIIPETRRVLACANQLELPWHLVVHQDDDLDEHTLLWQRELRSYGRNATLITSANIHEVRAYNMIAHAHSFGADVMVMLQDDDAPPHSCAWLERLVRVFRSQQRVGLVGMRHAELPESPLRPNQYERNSSSCNVTTCLCHRSLTWPMRYATRVDLAPLAVRLSAFGSGFPTTWTPPGNPGIGVDYVLSYLIWERDYRVLHLPTPGTPADSFTQLTSRPSSASNTGSDKPMLRLQFKRMQRVIEAEFERPAADGGEARGQRIGRRVMQLNEEEMVACAAGGGDVDESGAPREFK